MPDADLSILKRYYTQWRDLTAKARLKSVKALNYYDGDQHSRAELERLSLRSQPPIVINRLKVAINGIIGVTERGRSDPRAWPRAPDDTDTADAATDVLRYISDFNRFARLKQDCFLDLLVPGSMAALIGADADTQVTITQIRWEEFFFDPRSRRKDFKDARFLGIAKWMYADDVASLYPDKARQIASAVDNAGGALAPDQTNQDRPLQGALTGGAWVDPKQRRLMVIELYYREGPRWMRCVFTGSDILEEGASPYLDHKGRPDCPIEAMSAYVKQDNARYGAAHDMIGPQDEINKRRSKSLHILNTSRVEVADPSAIDVDADTARKEAARPDGVIPFGWRMTPNTAEFQGNLELLQEAKGELERMGPSPAMLGRSDDASGRHLLARQQSGLTELANLYGALEDWELRVYRQCWARAKQFWRAPQWIRVTDDEDAPRFVGLNQPVQDPETGVLGYRNAVAEMDVDIEIESQPDVGTIAQEQFTELMSLVASNPVWQQQLPLNMAIQLSTIPHKRAILDQIKQAADQAAQAQAQAQAMAQAETQARIGETEAKTQLHHASGFAHTLNALTEAHAMHADHVAAGLEKGIDSAQAEQAQAAQAQAQQTDIAAQQQQQAAQSEGGE